MKNIKRHLDLLKVWLGTPVTLQCGSSMNFLGENYKRGRVVPCHIGDEVIIHPIPGVSEATKSYPAKIATEVVNGSDGKVRGTFHVLIVDGIRGNKHRGWINSYLFGRLEFVKRNCKEESAWTPSKN